jgi:hypothetical protein
MWSENSPNEQRQDDSAWLDFSMTTVALAGSGRVTGNPDNGRKWGYFPLGDHTGTTPFLDPVAFARTNFSKIFL